jgi:hypothetical protein
MTGNGFFSEICMSALFGDGEIIDKKIWVAQALPYKGNPTYTTILLILVESEMSRILFKE